MISEETKKWIMLAEYKRISNKKKMELLNKYRNIYDVCNKLKIKEDYRINNCIEYIDKNNIEVLYYNGQYYPNQLTFLYDPPIVIYAIGNVKILNDKNKIAVIGARKASSYGINVSQEIGKSLSANNIHTISGLALGIDMNAHIGVLKQNLKNKNTGKGIAVIGNGLDNIYPYQNRVLAQKIVENGGCIITEYIVGTKPLKSNFPARNRIISALSDKLVVVEAEDERSGTMITVNFSLDLGKDILVIPGNITSKMSKGTNELIKDGAKIITKIEDIIVEDY